MAHAFRAPNARRNIKTAPASAQRAHRVAASGSAKTAVSAKIQVASAKQLLKVALNRHIPTQTHQSRITQRFRHHANLVRLQRVRLAQCVTNTSRATVVIAEMIRQA